MKRPWLLVRNKIIISVCHPMYKVAAFIIDTFSASTSTFWF